MEGPGDDGDDGGVRRGGASPSQWSMGRLLSTAARMVEREWNAHLAECHLTHAGLLALDALARGTHTQRSLAAACRVEEQTMRRVLERLERDGYVRRTRDGADRRRLVIEATDAGREALRSALADDVANTIVESAVTDADSLRGQLTQLVNRLSRGEDSDRTA
ncbi:MarR family transcriptional regulator [Actinospica sp. MGRD01-02]|uniref:MarR family transcriptional regulator n=1 Tax=Actinospica acidithermotolerans TaxID=2828514 RepID=A0A941IKF8_9ACTN|nr:MarR family transcriptional regulator [Actinospica acidithermotolerans]MBR7826676.1 MarR family transcriptional regulator [Actinospica acidithermotolerans]